MTRRLKISCFKKLICSEAFKETFAFYCERFQFYNSEAKKGWLTVLFAKNGCIHKYVGGLISAVSTTGNRGDK